MDSLRKQTPVGSGTELEADGAWRNTSQYYSASEGSTPGTASCGGAGARAPTSAQEFVNYATASISAGEASTAVSASGSEQLRAQRHRGQGERCKGTAL